MGYVPSTDTDQTGHLPSLIRVFAVHLKASYGSISYFLVGSKDLNQTKLILRLIRARLFKTNDIVS